MRSIWRSVAGRPGPASLYLVLTMVAFAGHFILPEPLASACYIVVSSLALVALAVGVRLYRPSSTRPWLLLGLGQAAFLVGDLLWYAQYLSSGVEPAYPSISDLFYMPAYPLLALGLLEFVRARQPRYRLAAAIDALLVGIAAVLVLWLAVIDGVIHDATMPLAERAVTVAYPIGDAVILALGAYLLLSGRHGRRAMYLLVGSLVALLGADALYAVIADPELATAVSDAFWMASYVMFGLAALTPSMRELTVASDELTAPVGLGRLLLLGGAVSVLPLFAVYQRYFADHEDLALLVALGLIVIVAVLLRMRELGAVLGRSERRYASLLANASDAFAIINPGGRFTYASPASDRVLGYAPGATVGRSVFEFVHPSRVATAAATLRQIADRPGAEVELEIPVQRADGQWRWLSVVATNRTDEPIVNGVVLNYRDVTDRHESEQRLDLQAQVLDEVQHAVFVTDTAGQLTYWNRAAEALFGWSAEEVIGRDIAELGLTPAEVPGGLLSTFDFDQTGRLSGEHELCRRDGSRLTALVTNSAMSGDDGRPRGFISVAVDITDRKQLEQRLQQQAFSDALTGLANRALFIDRIDHLLARRKRQSADVALAVLFIDLDDFKTVNDSMGHGAGDELLIALAARLQAALRPSDTAARLGGDEFAVLLEDAGVDDAEHVARRLLADMAEPVQLGAHDVQMSASIGIAVPPADRPYTAEELLRDADLAMYRAKMRVHGGYAVYHASMHEAALRRLELKADLQRAIEGDGLELAYQPIVRLADREIVGAEALLRWSHSDRGSVPVSEILALADAAGLSMQLESWVLNESCRAARTWLDVHPEDGELPEPFVSVNTSARVLVDPSFADIVAAALGRHDLPPAALTLEITESDLMHESDAAVSALLALKALGVSLAIDDFGTGYSSLAYLSRFPLDVLKIDRAFVATEDHTGPDLAIVRAIVELARSLDMRVVAEGVESARERDQMAALAVDLGQGYFLGRPDTGTSVGELFAARSTGGGRRAAGGRDTLGAARPGHVSAP